MKKRVIFSVLILLLLLSGFFAWKFFGSTVSSEDGKFLYIKSGATFRELETELTKNKFVKRSVWFRMVSRMVGYKTVKPGRYKVTQGMSLVNLVRMLKNGRQTPVNFVVTKIRTKESLAQKIDNAFECDSEQVMKYFNNQDTLKDYGLDTNTIMAAVLPLTYEIRWNTTPEKIFRQFITAYRSFWNEDRKEKARSLGLEPNQVVTLASIIDEETNAVADRPNIASVYLNRIRKGMPLQADPTVKFALKNFEIRRVMQSHLQTTSPYNTYQNKGLPPGPICTPALETVDAVLNAPKTDYLYFVANADFSGTHIFTDNYEDHMKYARVYQAELNKRNVK